jgi:PhnB protein
VTDAITAITPYLIVRNAPGAIEFYRRAFDAVETLRFEDEGGRVTHCELGIGSARLYLADEFPDQGILGPESMGGTGVILDMDVNDVEVWAARAVDQGAVLVRPLEVPDAGLQTAKLRDPFGHVWLLTRFVGPG